ncbi:MAG: DNA gyrase C-terminal beta-propeller domain-containing protein, partial [Pseudomonadota bacterium]
TKQGRIKRLSGEELTNVTRRGVTILKLKENDELLLTKFYATDCWRYRCVRIRKHSGHVVTSRWSPCLSSWR